ncbi:MAG TPA: class I SAM-dependent methyltransferase [Vicinamibacterales bacterium]|nr:class I SAM-dependent methyltransferase [Vicinamibacterales bacterium]
MGALDYDAIAADYDHRYAVNEYAQVQAALLALVAPVSNGRALEVGCGTGHWLRVLANAGVRVAGVDVSSRMLQRARSAAPGCAVVRATAERLPWCNGAFDRLYCVNALHHFDDRPGFVGEARRVLAPGGRLLTIGLDPHTGIDRWFIYEYFAPVREIDRQRYPSTERVREWLRSAGFTDVHTREVQHLPARLSARSALDDGTLAKHTRSQLALLSDDQYEEGLERIRMALRDADTRGETLTLTADLRLYGTYATAPR